MTPLHLYIIKMIIFNQLPNSDRAMFSLPGFTNESSCPSVLPVTSKFVDYIEDLKMISFFQKGSSHTI